MRAAHPRAIFPLLWLTASLVGCATGCGRSPDAAGLNADLIRAGVTDAIIFHEQGGPIDVERAAGGVLTLPDAVRRALRADPDVQGALARLRAAEAETEQTKLLPNPIVSVVSRFPENSGKPVIEADLGFELMSLVQRPGRISAADHRLRAASAEVVSAVLDAIAGVEDRYAAVQSLDAQMPVLEEQRSLVGRLYHLAQERLAQGEGTQLDVTTLEAQRLSLEVEAADMRLARREARLGLARLIGQPSGTADWKLSAWEAPRAGGPESAWIAAALQRRPEVASQRWELAALGVEARLARFSPFEPAEIGAKAERDIGEPWTVGPAVSVPLPLFDWGQAKRAKAAALRSEAEHKLTRIQRGVVEDVRKAHAAYVEAMAAMGLTRDRLIPTEERRRQETEAAYLNGQTDVTALTLADEDLQAAKLRLIELQGKASSALIRLQRAAGGPGVAAALGGASAPAAPASAPAAEVLPRVLTNERSQHVLIAEELP